LIGPGLGARVMVATRPVDLRKGPDAPAAFVSAEYGGGPYSGVIYVFRAKRDDRIKLVWWDGTGLCLMAKRLESGGFKWTGIQDGVMCVTVAQLSALVSAKSKLAEAIRYALSRWDGLTVFLDDGRVELDTNIIERSIRPLALSRKNALFAGSDEGGDNWAVIATPIENCKIAGINTQTWLTETLTKLANDHPANCVGELMPWVDVG